MTIGLLGLGILLASGPVLAGLAPAENVDCVLGAVDPGGGGPGLTCSANDVELTDPTVFVIDSCDFPGDTARLDLSLDVRLNASNRYDIGAWFSVDGDPDGNGSIYGTCSVMVVPQDWILNTLPPQPAPPPIADTGYDTDLDGDSCGDGTQLETGAPVIQIPEILNTYLGAITLICADGDGDGQLDAPIIISWDQQAGNVCTAPEDTAPNAPSKCKSEATFNLPVPIPGRIIVVKDTVPEDATVFGFNLSGPDSGVPGGFDGSHDFTLADGQQFDSGSGVFFGGLLAGDNYAISETPNSLYDSVGTCVSDLDPPGANDNSDPADIDLNSGETVICTFTNTRSDGPQAEIFTVIKDFSDDNPASVTVSLTCTSGTIVANDLAAAEGAPAVFTIQDFAPGATCTATESGTPAGYIEDISDCQDGDPVGGSCMLVNTLETQPDTAIFTVNKDFSDDNPASVTVSLTCTSGTVAANDLAAAEGAPAVFTIEEFAPGATCTATESGTPAGYGEDISDCQDGDPVGGGCTLVNTLNAGQFTVNKDFNDDNPASVTVSLTCTSGTVAANDLPAAEGAPAVFTVEGFAQGATCTATESGTPAGYTEDISDCQNGDPVDGGCTLVNSLIPPPPEIEVPANQWWALLVLIGLLLATVRGQLRLAISKVR